MEKKALGKGLEALLIEGLESGPATEMTETDWEEMRRRFAPWPTSSGRR